jgi:hypothetical protein
MVKREARFRQFTLVRMAIQAAEKRAEARSEA